MAQVKRTFNKIESTTYVDKDEDEARLLQLIEQAENRSVNEQ